jgi:hypothetical protein
MRVGYQLVTGEPHLVDPTHSTSFCGKMRVAMDPQNWKNYRMCLKWLTYKTPQVQAPHLDVNNDGVYLFVCPGLIILTHAHVCLIKTWINNIHIGGWS